MQKFIEDIDELVAETIRMCDYACRMIDSSVTAIVDGNVELADSVEADFKQLDALDEGIEEDAVRILTIYQPTAIDARTVTTILKSITYLERIGKYSYNIAKATKYLVDKPMYPPVNLIQPLGEVAVRMVKLVVGAFETRDISGLDRISEMDDYLDRNMRKDLDEIIAFIRQNPDSADVCTYYISVIKFLERVGDHCCKMAEKVHFMVTGEHVEID